MNDREILNKSKKMGRTFGPIFLFIFFPLVLYILIDVTMTEKESFFPLEKIDLLNLSIPFLFFCFGSWLIYVGFFRK